MNSTFKVVFNKARGALMVVNEVTSSVQAKGTKTVVATAVAAMIAGVASTAMAAEEATPPVVISKATVFDEAQNYNIALTDQKTWGLYVGTGGTETHYNVEYKDGLTVKGEYTGNASVSNLWVNGTTLSVTGPTDIEISTEG